MKIVLGKRRVAGSMLLEAVLALAALGVIGASLMGSFAYSYFVLQLTRENQRATQILVEKVETIRLYNWDQVRTPGFIPGKFTDTYDPQGTSGQQGVTYNGTVVITNVPFASSYQDNMRQLILRLDWTSSHNLPRSRTLVTYISRDGLQNYVY